MQIISLQIFRVNTSNVSEVHLVITKSSNLTSNIILQPKLKFQIFCFNFRRDGHQRGRKYIIFSYFNFLVLFVNKGLVTKESDKHNINRLLSLECYTIT